MNTNPQATTTPNTPQKPVTPTTVAPATSTLSLKKDESAPAAKPQVEPVKPTSLEAAKAELKQVSEASSRAISSAAPGQSTLDAAKVELKRISNPQVTSTRKTSPEQKEALLVNRLMNLNDYLNVSDKDLEQGRQAVEKRIKALQQLERTIVKYQKDRAQKVQEQERAITAQKAMDLFLEGKKEEGMKLFDQYRAKYGDKK